MTPTWNTTPAWPTVHIHAQNKHTETTIGGIVTTYNGDDHRTQAIDAITQYASRLGRNLRAKATDNTGTWQLIATPDGELSDAGPATPLLRRRRRRRIPF